MAAEPTRETLRFRCVVCGKLTAGCLPRINGRGGPNSVRFPRKHRDKTGALCEGNDLFAEWVVVECGVLDGIPNAGRAAAAAEEANDEANPVQSPPV